MDILPMASNLVYSIIPMFLAITVREASRAWVSKKLGDNTSYQLGRVTLDPVAHIEMYGTIVFPLIMFLVTQGAFLFGWGKQLPINENNFKKNKRDNIILGLTGPLSNFFMALLWLVVFQLLSLTGSTLPLIEGMSIMSKIGIFLNLTFMAFTLIPLLPLDGGKIVKSLLPLKVSIEYSKLEPYGFYIIMLLAILGVTSVFTTPIIDGATVLLGQLF